MQKNTSLLIVFFLVLVTVTTNTDAQENPTPAFSLPDKAAASITKISWDKNYQDVIGTLESRNFVPGRILFKKKNSLEVYLWKFDPKINMAQALTYVKNLPDIEYCQPDYIYKIEKYVVKPFNEEQRMLLLNPNHIEADTNQPNDPYYKWQVHLKVLGMDKIFQKYGPELRSLPVRGVDPYIHIVDTGGGCYHPDLTRANIIPKRDFIDFDDDPCSSPNGMNNHGAFIAAIMGAKPNNNHGGSGIVPPNTKLLIWRVFNKDGNGFSSSISGAISQIVSESSGNGNDIVNMSFSSSAKDPLIELSILLGGLPTELGGKNIIFFASSGNSGQQNIEYPAAIEGVLSLGASELPLIKNGQAKRANYSSYGKVDLLAPVGGLNQDNDQNGIADGIIVEGTEGDGTGPSIYSPYFFWGTSGATPMASATAALLINLGICGPQAIYKILTKTADDLSPTGLDTENGWGVLRADVAVIGSDNNTGAFGSFNQNAYTCLVPLGESTCSTSVHYTIRSKGIKTYLYHNRDGGTLRYLGDRESEGDITITARLGTKTGILILYVLPGSQEFVTSASAVLTPELAEKPIASFDGQNYICAISPGQNTCEAIVRYTIKTNGWNVFFYDNYGGGTLRPLGNSVEKGTQSISVSRNRDTGILLLYYPDGMTPVVITSAEISSEK